MFKQAVGRKSKALLLPAVIFIIWCLGSKLQLFNSYLVPPPAKVFTTALYLLKKGILLRHLVVSFYRVFVGFAITFLAAFLLAVIIALNTKLSAYILPLLEFIRHIPPIALIPLLILWLGIGEESKLMVIVLATFFPVFLNTLSGINNCDPKLVEVGHVFGLSRRERFFKIVLPQALPAIIVGMQIGLGYSWRSLIGAELIAASSGIGYMIIEAEQLSRPDIILVGVFTIGLFGYLIDYLFFKLTAHYLERGNNQNAASFKNKQFN